MEEVSLVYRFEMAECEGGFGKLVISGWLVQRRVVLMIMMVLKMYKT